LNTSGSSLTEEIFNTALSNLEFLSDNDSGEEAHFERKNSNNIAAAILETAEFKVSLPHFEVQR